MIRWIAPLLLFFSFFLPAKEPWGWHTQIDLHNCNSKLISSKHHIETYVKELCDLIDMKRFGDPIVIDFGLEPRVAGYSMFQLIETSNISGHFANESNRAFIDIFSCKKYNEKAAAEFTAAFFCGKISSIKITERK